MSPVLRVDMQYVGAKWREELRREARRDALVSRGVASVCAPIVATHRSTQKAARGPVITVKRGKKHSEKSRPQKCWYCEQRHPKGGTHIALHLLGYLC